MSSNLSNINKITLTAVFLALITITNIIFDQLPGMFYPFLKVHVSDLFILILISFVGIYYCYSLAIISPWMFLLFSKSGIIDILALMLSSLGFLSFFIIFKILLKIIFKNKLFKNIRKNSWIICLVASIFAIIFNSFLMTLMNYLFILDLYGAPDYKTEVWKFFLPFNLIKFTIVATGYLIIIIGLWPFYQKYGKNSY